MVGGKICLHTPHYLREDQFEQVFPFSARLDVDCCPSFSASSDASQVHNRSSSHLFECDWSFGLVGFVKNARQQKKNRSQFHLLVRRAHILLDTTSRRQQLERSYRSRVADHHTLIGQVAFLACIWERRSEDQINFDLWKRRTRTMEIFDHLLKRSIAMKSVREAETESDRSTRTH